MDALNFLKFWRHAATATVATTAAADLHLPADPANGSEEDDSFFDLELTLHDFDNRVKDTSKIDIIDETMRGEKAFESRENEFVVLEKPVTEPISKRKVLPIEPVSKPQSPISLLKSAPSFRIFTFKKPKESVESETTTMTKEKKKKEKETKVFALKLNLEDTTSFSSPASLSRSGSSRSHGSKSERFSKEVFQKYLKLIKPLYVKISRRNNGEKTSFSGDLSSKTTSFSSPSVVSSVPSFKREKQGNNIRGGACKHLGKSKSASAASLVAGVSSPANRSDDTLLQQHDGIQSAILHCKRSLNSRDYASSSFEEKSICPVRKSF